MTGRYLIPLKNKTHLYRILTTPVLFYHSARHRILPSFKNDRQECNTVENRITLAVILERSEESRQRIQVLNTLFTIDLCRILR